VNQTQRWPIGNSPLGALLDPAKDVTRYGHVLPSLEANTLNIRVEDRAHAEYGAMVLSFASKPVRRAGWNCWAGRRWMRRIGAPRCGCRITSMGWVCRTICSAIWMCGRVLTNRARGNRRAFTFHRDFRATRRQIAGVFRGIATNLSSTATLRQCWRFCS
jgi:hypothetical protein